MSDLIFDINAPGAWQKVYDETKHVIYQGQTSYIPIPRFTIPILFEERVIAIGTSSESARQHWWLGGHVIQQYPISAISSKPLEATKRKVQLNNLTLLVMPKLANEYQLAFEVVPWIEDLTVAIWVYGGLVSQPTEEQLDAIRVDLARIEQRIINMG